MAMALRTCLLDVTGDNEGTFRMPFYRLDELCVVDLCSDWTELQEHLRHGSIDLVAVNLDAPEQPRFLSIRRIIELAPECAILGVSGDNTPDTIIAAMRAGCAQFVRAPIDPEDLREAVDRVRQIRCPMAAGYQQISVIGSAGGAGATTLACNLAIELAQLTGRRTAVVDMDLQFGDVACAFDVTPKYSVADVCRAGMAIDRTLLEMALEELPCNVSILGRPENLGDGDDVSAEAVEQLLRHLAQLFPFTVVDTPRIFSPAVLATLKSSDRVLIVSQVGVPFLRNATRICRVLLESGMDERRIDLVLNRCQASHERITLAEVEKHFGRPALARIPNDYKHITASRDLGHPILAHAPQSPARQAIHELAGRLAERHLDQAADTDRKRGLFGLFGKKKRAAKSAAAAT